MGNTKFDLIATSQKKGYRITMIVLAVLGLLLIGVGLIMRLSVTSAVMPNKLELVSMPGLEGASGSFSATISQDEYFVVSTGTNDKVLAQGITFTLDDEAAKFLKPIRTAYRDGLFQLVIADDAPTNTTGTLTIGCGSMPKITVVITYVKKS